MKTRVVVALVAACCLLMVLPSCGYAEQAAAESEASSESLPLWEIKLFAGAIRLPHYRGSDEYEVYAAPLPFLEYRGRHFRANRQGLHGIFTRSRRFEFTLSAYGNPPVNDDSEVREGMEELDPIFELGPSLKWYFTPPRAQRRMYLQASVRGVASVGLPESLRTEYQGIHSVVEATYVNRKPLGYSNWRTSLTLGADFTDSDYNRYFYDVTDRDARPGRPRYHAGGGYAGMKLSGSLSRRISKRFSAMVYGRLENISGAVFQNSPLVEAENNFTVGAAIVWRLLKSKKTAPGVEGE